MKKSRLLIVIFKKKKRNRIWFNWKDLKKKRVKLLENYVIIINDSSKVFGKQLEAMDYHIQSGIFE